MKVTKEKAAENRAALVRTAGRLFRERGVDGVGVAEICKAAGLTHGALYAQFPSKDALAAEALAHGLKRSHAAMMAIADGGKPNLTAYLDFLISVGQRDALANGCAMTASASEIGRQDEVVSACFAEGFEAIVALIRQVLDQTESEADARRRALAIVAAEIGAIAVARATAKSRPDLSDEILGAVRGILGEVGREPREGSAGA